MRVLLAVLLVGIAGCGGAEVERLVTEQVTAEREAIPRSTVFLANDDVLQDLQGVGVLVESLHDNAKAAGLTVASLETMIELRLRQLRVPVLSDAQRRLDPRSPYLYLNVGVLDISDSPLFTYSLSLHISETVEVLNSSSSERHMTRATTWKSLGHFGYAGSRVVKEAITETIREMVDDFANSYLSTHAASPP